MPGPAPKTVHKLREIIAAEPPEAPYSDTALAAELGVTEQRVSVVRRQAGVPTSRVRGKWVYEVGLARCAQCHAWYELPKGTRERPCPAGHGTLRQSLFRLTERTLRVYDGG